VIGCGEVGVKNTRAIRRAPNAHPTIVMDLDEHLASDLGKQFNVPYTNELEVVLEHPDVDVVIVCTPTWTHHSLVVQAALHGKHVIVEKPMSVTLREADEMVAACHQHHVRLSVHFWYRYSPQVQRAKKLIEQGAIGKLLGTLLVLHMDKPLSAS